MRSTLSIVTVEWRDAVHLGCQIGADSRELAESLRIISSGVLAYEDDAVIAVSLDWMPELRQFRHTTTIPKGIVDRIVRRSLREEK